MINEGMSTLKTDAQARQAALQNLLRTVDLSTKEADTAFLIELVGGIFGLFGLGYLYTGLQNTGLFRLVGYIVVGIVVLTLFGICATLTLGLAACFAPLLFIPQLVLAYFSANDLKVSINAVKAGGYTPASASATPSNFGGYIQNPAPMPSDINLTPRAPEVAVPPMPPTPEVTLTPPPAPYTPSTPDVTYSPSIEDTIASLGDDTSTTPSAPPYTPSNVEGTDVDDNNDFNPDDLTKKV